MSPPFETMTMLRELQLCLAMAASVNGMAQFDVTLIADSANCGNNDGYVQILALNPGGVYTYQWSNGATTPAIHGLSPGIYSVEVTDAFGNSITRSATVHPGGTEVRVGFEGYQACGPGTCEGRAIVSSWVIPIDDLELTIDPPSCSAAMAAPVAGWENALGWTDLQEGQTYTVTVSDGLGCTSTYVHLVMQNNDPVFTPQIGSIVPACGNENNGAFSLVADGPLPGWHLFDANDQLLGWFWFTEQPYTFTGLAAGSYQVQPQFGSDSGTNGYCNPGLTVVIPEFPEPCTGIAGHVYHDENNDCLQGSIEFPLPNRVLTIEPGPVYAFTAMDGSYDRPLPSGSYTITQAYDNETTVCPVTDPQPFTVDATTPLPIVDFAKLNTIPLDLEVVLIHWPAVIGAPTGGSVTVRNLSSFHSADVELNVNLDEDLQNVIWSGPMELGVIPPFGQVVRYFNAYVPPLVELLDEFLTHTATATNGTTEANTSNNTATISEPILGAYDPNDKQALTSSGSSGTHYFVDVDEWIDYTIRFQNTGTAPATTVLLRDTIDTDLMIPSIEILGASHAFVPSFGDDRELVFTFNDINLPDSSVDLLGSQGFISYRIKPKNDIVIGDIIKNTANIYFDFNPPITTNTVEHVVELSTGVKAPAIDPIVITPNPATDLIILRGIGKEALAYLHVISIDGRSIQAPMRWSGTALELDIRSLAPGTYIVLTPQGQARFVKQ
ncbi:MAG: T9SS type A sorting domain-containing protein [Flavobacteriales bacterium]|nr:T9SS type A sorting domain-containing protein [Flavobacteriales bacterium]